MMSAALSGLVSIDSHRGCKPYNPMIYGQFLEHFHRQVYGGVFAPESPLADERGLRLDVAEALRALRVPIVRWPGGCYVSAYHWKDGVGPQRQPSYDKAWRVEDPNAFGTDEFVAWCRLIGAEPYICTNAGTGTPEEMSDWVEYCNLASAGRWARLRQAGGFREPHAVRYWSIGNENYGGWEMGAKTVAEWGRFVRESAKMMKQVDPSIVLLAAALPDVDWTLNLLREAGPLLDMVSIHGYYDPLWREDKPSDYVTCMLRSGEVERIIQATEQIIAIAGHEGRIGIAFDEWNLRGWHHPLGNSAEAIGARDRNDINATYTMADAVFSAGFLNTCLRHADTVRMANMAPVVNTRGPLYVYPGGLVKRTTYHVLWMYANLLAEQVADAWVSGGALARGDAATPALDAVVTCDASMRRWRLALVNRHPDQELSCQVIIDGRTLEGRFSGATLVGDSTDACNDVEHPQRVAPAQCEFECVQGTLRLPAHSVSVVKVG
jgi:alpha-N-arabinofuranosidase